MTQGGRRGYKRSGSKRSGSKRRGSKRCGSKRRGSKRRGSSKRMTRRRSGGFGFTCANERCVSSPGSRGNPMGGF